jgi:hypothetical protein
LIGIKRWFPFFNVLTATCATVTDNIVIIFINNVFHLINSPMDEGLIDKGLDALFFYFIRSGGGVMCRGRRWEWREWWREGGRGGRWGMFFRGRRRFLVG